MSQGWTPEHDQSNWVDKLVEEHGGEVNKKPLGKELMRANDRGPKKVARQKAYRERKKRERGR